jgi:hypothetical protein
MGGNRANPITQVAIPISLRNQNFRNTVITHSEFIGTVTTSSTSFQLNKFISIQPGLNVAFPWLSTIAGNFDRYRFLSLEFDFIPACPTSTLGTVYMAFDPDALDNGPIQTSDMFQYKANLQFSPFLTQKLKLSKDLIDRILYTRLASQNIGNGDLKTYDVGSFFLATDMTASGVSLGTIRMTYRIVLIDPQPRADGYIGYAAQYTGNSTNTFSSVVYNSMPVIVPSVLATNTIQIKASGLYYFWYFSSSSSGPPTPTYTGGLSLSFVDAITGGASSSALWAVLATGPGSMTINALGNSITNIVKAA